MKRITAEEIMIPLDSYPHVPYWFSLRQAIAAMEAAQLQFDGLLSLPRVVLVFDEQYQLIGMVRRRDILRGLGRNALQDPTEHPGEQDPSLHRDLRGSGESGDKLWQKIRERSERPVSEVMIPIRISLSSTTSLSELIDFIVVNDCSIVPVIKDNSVVGVVRSTDVLHHVGKLLI